MGGATPVTYLDDTANMTGTHKGSNGAASLSDPGAGFRSTGIDPDLDLLIKNTTDGSEGPVTAATEDSITATLTGGTNNTWANGDAYETYLTDTEDSLISTHWTDKRFGQKVVNPAQLDEDGVFPEDADLDEKDDEVWGPGQPIRHYRG